MPSKEQSIELVKSAILALETELSAPSDPTLIKVPKNQKEVFKQKLQSIYDILNSGSLPEKNQRNLGLSRAIADSWPLSSTLGEAIAKAEMAFIDTQ